MAKENKEEQKRILTELMEADQKNGLYDHIGDTNKMVTAVQFLLDKIIESNASKSGDVVLHGYLSNTDIENAKQIEKERMNECWNVAHQAGRFEGKGIADENWQTFIEYYNETYGKE